MGLLVVLIVVPFLTSGCGSNATNSAAASSQSPRRGGTIWLEAVQEPPVLNSYLAAGGMSITDVLTTPMKSQWIVVDDRGTWQPLIASSVPTLENGQVRLTPAGGMDITLRIDPAAVWSDGVPITCADLTFTWRTVMTRRNAIGSRLGWNHVTAIDCPTARHAVMHLDEPFAPYLATLLGTAPLPAHVLRGRDFNTAWNDSITVSSGPFVFESWKRGDRLVMQRNPRWWRAGDAGKPYVDRLVVRFVPDASTMKLDLRMEDADVIGPPPDTTLPDELGDIRSAKFSIQPGSTWENLTFNTTRFPFDDARVRRAAAYAIDRDALVDVVLQGQVPRLDSPLLPSQAPYYAPAFNRYHRNLEIVERTMHDAGFQRDRHDRWTKGGRTARVELLTTSGNPLRLKAVQMLALQLSSAGFDPDISILRPEVFFASYVSRGRFDLAMYAFSQAVDPSLTKYFACSEIASAPAWAGKNNFHYCRPHLDTLLHRADRELDVQRRAATTHAIVERLAMDVPAIPLYQVPDTLAWSRRVHNVRPNALGRHLWNVDEWWVERP